MSHIFTRPERPAELSRHDIAQELIKGSPFFCGRCRERIEIKSYLLRACPCQHPIDINSVGAFRVEQGQIILDIFLVRDTDFNPHIHIPMKQHRKRSHVYHSAGYGDD